MVHDGIADKVDCNHYDCSGQDCGPFAPGGVAIFFINPATDKSF